MLTRHCAPIIFKLCFADFFLYSVRHYTIGAGCIGAQLILADYTVSKMIVFGAPRLYGLSNFLLTELYKQEMEILWRIEDCQIKIKQTLISTVRNHLLTVAWFPTPLIFHCPLPWRYRSGQIRLTWVWYFLVRPLAAICFKMFIFYLEFFRRD